jgi:hypothetical protein
MGRALCIDSSLISQMATKVQFLLDHYEPSEREADYVCVFCGNRAERNGASVVHKDNCLGVRFLKAYNEADEGA